MSIIPKVSVKRRQEPLAKGGVRQAAESDRLAKPSETGLEITLPEGWRFVKLPELGELTRGKSRHRPRNEPSLYGGPYPFVQTGDIRESGGTIRAHTQTYSELGLSQSRLWPAGTLCITIAANIAETAILSYPACFPDSVVGFRYEGEPTTVRFIEFYFRIAKAELERLAPATAQKNINVEVLSKLEIPLPPLPEQRRIVAEIEKQFTRLEAGVAALKRVQANLKRYRAAVLKAACEGKLVPTEAELAKAGKVNANFETGEELLTRILSDRRTWFDEQQADFKTKKKYTEPAKPEIAGLAKLPVGWTWGTWNQLSNWVTYGFTRPMPHVDEGLPIITAKGVNKGRIVFEGADLTTHDAYTELSEKDRPKIGDILITKDGTIGRAAVVDTDREFCINQSVAVIWLRSCPMERKFLLTVIESELTQKPIWAKARGVAIQHLSITDFAKMSLPIPPLAEQTRIVAEVERRFSVLDELEAMATANLQRAARLRQSILRKAFEGKLV